MNQSDYVLTSDIDRHGRVTPRRIQLSRQKGWRLPPDAVSVARPTRWGNPYRVGHVECALRPGGVCYRVARDGKIIRDHIDSLVQAHEIAVDAYRTAFVNGNLPYGRGEARAHLRGKDLGCWCKPSHPCHVDVLLPIVNEGTVTSDAS